MYNEFHTTLDKSIREEGSLKYDKREFWKEEAILFTKDINKTIDFINNDCSDQEFYILSEIFQEIAEISKSKEFLTAIIKRMESITDPEYIRSIDIDIDIAKSIIESNN